MAKSLSNNDLRRRLVEAVEGGMSRRSAVKRYGITVSTAIK
jgi:transposase